MFPPKNPPRAHGRSRMKATLFMGSRQRPLPHHAPKCLAGESEAWVDGFAFEGEDAEDWFVDAAEGFVADEAVEGFEAEGEFA